MHPIVLLYPLITAMFYYLGARAMITQWLWSRYPPWLDHFMMCSACTGVWYGAAVAAVGGYGLGVPFVGLAGDHWSTVIVVALCSGVWTPFMSLAHIKALEALGSTAPVKPDAEPYPQRILDGHGNYWDCYDQQWKPLPK